MTERTTSPMPNTLRVREIIQQIMPEIRNRFVLDIQHGIHGAPHWSRVLWNARMLAQHNFNGVHFEHVVPPIFAILHDSCRDGDGEDYEHGPAAAVFAQELYDRGLLTLIGEELELLKRALAGHSDGETLEHPVVQICWDADRLDLWRVGIMPDPRYLCTDHAKKPETIAMCVANVEKAYG